LFAVSFALVAFNCSTLLFDTFLLPSLLRLPLARLLFVVFDRSLYELSKIGARDPKPIGAIDPEHPLARSKVREPSRLCQDSTRVLFAMGRKLN
jgi:hypothetical protein